MTVEKNNDKWLSRIWIFLMIISLIGGLVYSLAARASDIKQLQINTAELKQNKVDKAQYETDIGYIKDGIREIRADLRRHTSYNQGIGDNK